MKPEKQKEKASETMDIYAPIAQRLGISKIKIELDDLSLKYLKPEVYYDLVEKIASAKRRPGGICADALWMRSKTTWKRQVSKQRSMDV